MLLSMIAGLVLVSPLHVTVGDHAPALNFDEIKGHPVHSFRKEKVTVVEFWATWCGPCIQNMPHLSELWTKYKDKADFVGVSVMENDWSKVRPFVESMGEKLAYPAAVDKVDKAGKGFMQKNWLEAAQQNGIPVAFVVDKTAHIAWIGHPATLEPVLTKVIDGTWDTAAFKLKFEGAMKDESASNALLKDAYDRISGTVRTHSYGDTSKWIEANRKNYDGPQTQAALDVFKQLFDAFAAGQYADALKQAETPPTNGFVWTYFRPMLVIAQIDAMQGLDRGDDWKTVVQKAIDGPPDPNLLIALADAMAMPDSKLKQKDPSLAMKVSTKLASMARDPMFLVRLAWAYHASGEKDKAEATLAEAFSKMPQEKARNPQFYEEMLKSLNEAKAEFAKGGS
jgi:thiol-disulfide isomerase/thioredoxin